MNIMRFGDVGPEVEALQEHLQNALLPLPGGRDGVYGRYTEQAVRWFQQECVAHDLAVDGVCGPLTWTALVEHLEGGGWLTAHFRSGEFASPDTGEAVVLRQLAQGLEMYRELVGAPVFIVSGYRTLAHNLAVGGAAFSMHRYGAAVDLAAIATVEAVQSLRVFSGIGDQGGAVRHVDVRHVTGPLNQTPEATPDNPARWSY